LPQEAALHFLNNCSSKAPSLPTAKNPHQDNQLFTTMKSINQIPNVKHYHNKNQATTKLLAQKQKHRHKNNANNNIPRITINYQNFITYKL
jgi:hypothetical protein